MQYDHRIIGRVIGRIRVQRELSQEVLSGLAGIARSHLAMIENGSKSPNMATLWRIAYALDMPLSALIALMEAEYSYHCPGSASSPG